MAIKRQIEAETKRKETKQHYSDPLLSPSPSFAKANLFTQNKFKTLKIFIGIRMILVGLGTKTVPEAYKNKNETKHLKNVCVMRTKCNNCRYNDNMLLQ